MSRALTLALINKIYLIYKQAEHEAVEQARVDREKAILRFPSGDTESIPDE
jgi:hypothetical protein